MWPDRMERDRGRSMRYDERWGGGESYRPAGRISRSRSRSRIRRPRSRSRSRNRSPRLTADTWVPQGGGRHLGRYRSRSPPANNLRRSRSPPYRQRQRILSPPRNGRPRSPYGPSWRSRSPYSQKPPSDYQPSRFAGDSSRPPYPPRSPRRDQPPSPPGRYRDYPSPSRPASIRERPPYGRPVGRSKSPYYRNEQYPRNDSNPRRRTRSPVKPGLSDHPSSHNSASTSRRSSPPANFDRPSTTPSRPRSRSPVDLAAKVKAKSVERAPVPSSAVGSSSHLSYDNARNSPLNSAQERAIPERSDKPVADRPGLSPRVSVSSEKNDYPKGPGLSDPRGSQQETGQSTQNRPSNISLLSAPTRPKGASNFHPRDHPREPTWAGRRAPPPPLQQTPPTGPRNRYVQAPPVNDLQRGPAYRPSNGLSVPHHQRSPRPNYLATLPTVVAGGRLLPPAFDAMIEKRLSQLESDEDKLIDQVLEKQRSKRVGLKDWDRLERESALNALKSELAEMHLQRMTEGEGFEGATVF